MVVMVAHHGRHAGQVHAAAELLPTMKQVHSPGNRSPMASPRPSKDLPMVDPLMMQLRRICTASNVPISIGDDAASMWGKLLVSAPEVLDSVLTDGILQGRFTGPRPTSDYSPSRRRRFEMAASAPSTPRTEVPSPRARASTVPGGKVREDPKSAATGGMPAQEPPAVGQRAGSSETPTSVAWDALPAIDMDHFPLPLPREQDPGNTTLPASHILSKMIVSSERLELELQHATAVTPEDTSKGVEAARYVALRSHVSGMRLSQQQFEHLQMKAAKEIGELTAELEALRRIDKRRRQECQRLRWALSVSYAGDVQEEVHVGMCMCACVCMRVHVHACACVCLCACGTGKCWLLAWQ